MTALAVTSTRMKTTPPTVSGTVTDVEDGQTVEVVITDSAGIEVTGSAMVAGGAWSPG